MNLLQFLPDTVSGNILFRLLFSFIFGALIGFERDVHGRPAGLRTNILVSLGSCTFMILSFFAATLPGLPVQGDPTRIAAQIITGIGFIGAGAILKHGFSIKGLTTAASLWISSALGMCCGAGYIELAGYTTVLAIITLQLLDLFERKIPRDTYRRLRIITDADSNFDEIMSTIKNLSLKVLSYDHEYDYESQRLTMVFALKMKSHNTALSYFNSIKSELEKLDLKISRISWEAER